MADINDIAGLYSQMSTEYKRLPQLYNLWAILLGSKTNTTLSNYGRYSCQKWWSSGELVDANLKVREDFYEALTAFASCLKVALQSATFFADTSFSDTDRRHYKETLKQFFQPAPVGKTGCRRNRPVRPIRRTGKKAAGQACGRR